MILLPLAFIGAIGLTIWIVFLSEASLRAKIIVGALFVVSFACRYMRFSLVRFFIQVSLCVFVLLYLAARQK